jgi:hypothetical protein
VEHATPDNFFEMMLLSWEDNAYVISGHHGKLVFSFADNVWIVHSVSAPNMEILYRLFQCISHLNWRSAH